MSSRRVMKKQAQSGGPIKTEDARIVSVADWLRNEKVSGLKTKEAVQYEKRVEYFKGSKLIDALLGPKYKGKVAALTPIKTRTEAAKLGQELLRLQYFHRSQRVSTPSSRRWELEMMNGPFEEEGLYTWVYEGSKTKLYLLCAGMLFVALLLCMIQIWPLWLKIGVWWCSVTFLTTFGVLCVVRLILFALMWIVGFRGIWLFPNLFDDNQTFAGSFMPVFGKGDPVVVEEDSDDEYWEYAAARAFRTGHTLSANASEVHRYQRKKHKKKESSGGEEKEEEPKKKKSGKEEKKEEPMWQFGWINVMIIFGIGALGCVKLGFFDGENVPDFVAKRDDLEYYFKSLAPPEQKNETSGESRDPFAAPKEEGQRF